MENIICLDGRTGIFVPLDHADVLQSQPSTHLYCQVRDRIDKDEARIAEHLVDLGETLNHPAWSELLADASDDSAPFWNNGFFSGDDARFLVGMLRHYRSERYIEIGSGNSTKFTRWAISKFLLPTHITSIDPVPRATIRHLADEVIEQSVLQAPLEIFDRLEAGDILFHDGSHLVFNGTDSVHLFLEIMPRLASGVLLHIHDMSLPFEYVQSFDHRGYNEQYLLAAALLFGDAWEVIAPVAYLKHQERIVGGGTSFWLRRR